MRDGQQLVGSIFTDQITQHVCFGEFYFYFYGARNYDTAQIGHFGTTFQM